MSEILRATAWPTNAHMIADVAKLGYLDGTVFDATYGLGNFWTEWKPEVLVTNDLYMPADYAFDFTKMPLPDQLFDVVVLDPPYKLNGTPSKEDVPYGVQWPTRWQDRITLIMDGTRECARVAKKTLLVKCMDQVVSGQMVWQTWSVILAARSMGMQHVDRFDLLRTPRPQPGDRGQQHARGNYSTLLVFARTEMGGRDVGLRG